MSVDIDIRMIRGMSGMMALVAVLAVTASPAFPLPHEGDHSQIERASRLLEEEPGEAALYLQRARLYRNHGDHGLAMADIETAAELDPSLEGLDRVRGELFIDLGWGRAARVVLDRHLAANPDDAEVLLTSARLHRRMGKAEQALAQYDKAIALLERPTPEHYLERAEVTTSLGEAWFGRAIAGLDQGIVRLGPAVSIVLAAVDLELEVEHYESALARIRGLAQQSSRKERWLVREGDILIMAGRRTEALDVFTECRKAIDALPPAQRDVKLMAKLRQQVDNKIRTLDQE